MKLMLVTNPPGTGGSHKWEETTPSLEGILQEAGHTVDVTSTGEELARPDLASYDAILLNMWRNPRFGVDLEETERDGLHTFVSNGGGLISIHVSPDSCPYWPAMQEMTAGGWVTGKSTHPPLMTFTVRVTDSDNPCAAGVEDFETWDELYIQLNVSPRANVFLHSEYEGTDWPLGWTATYGKGRVFNTALGHAAESHNAGFRRLLMNGLAWVTHAGPG